MKKKGEKSKDEKILINGVGITPKEFTLKVVFAILLAKIDFKNSRRYIIQKNLRSVFDIMTGFCEDEREGLKGKERAKYTRAITNLDNQRRRWLDKSVSKADLQRFFYNAVLLSEELGPLPGFGARNNKGDVLYGSPERQSIDSLRCWS